MGLSHSPSSLFRGAAAVAALLLGSYCGRVGAGGEPVALEDLEGLLQATGKGDDYGTGERISREAIVLFHKQGLCTPDFSKLGMFAKNDHLYVLASVDVDHVNSDLMEALRVKPEELEKNCPVAVVVEERSLVDNLQSKKVVGTAKTAISQAIISTQAVTFGFLNQLDEDVKLTYSWNDEPEQPMIPKETVLTPGKERWITTYRTTVAIARRVDTGEELGRRLIDYTGEFIVNALTCNALTCGIEMRDTGVTFTAQEEKAMDMSRRSVDHNNRKQPGELPVFTDIGFKKVTVPDDVWDLVQTYYHRNQNDPKLETWGKNNVFTNNKVAPTYMVNLPEQGIFKPKLFNGIRPILEEWAGCELEQTACYGIRVYTNGSWLVNHVDSRATHAVSVIINVDQEVDEPWPLMIHDHEGNDYNITMKPRDMVLYESATCIHGRPTYMEGSFYSNMFVHYRPTDPEKWKIYNEKK